MIVIVIVIMLFFRKSRIHERVFEEQRRTGSLVCQQMCEKNIEMFKYNVHQRKIGRDLHIPHSTVQNVFE